MSNFFSIILPIFNAAGTIECTLDSIRFQTIDRYEVIAVDDGSTDSSCELIEKYQEQNKLDIKVIRQENKGVGAARNTGIRNSEGDLIAFLDSDDLWYPEKLERVQNVFESRANVDLVCHDEDVLKMGRVVRTNRYGPHNTYEDLFFKGNCLSTSATVVRRDPLFEVGLLSEDKAVHGVDDYDLWLKLSRAGFTFFFLHELLGAYVLQEISITSDIGGFTSSCLNLLKYHYAAYPNKNLKHRLMFKERLSKNWRGAAKKFMHRGEYQKARRCALESLKINIFSWKSLLAVFASITKLRY